MKIETKAVHAGDRKRNPDAPGAFVPSSTPIYTATTYLYEDTAKLDRVLGREEPGFCYGRYDNPTRTGLEELLTELESGRERAGLLVGHDGDSRGVARRADGSAQVGAGGQRALRRDDNAADPSAGADGSGGRFRRTSAIWRRWSTRSPKPSPAAS